MKYEEFEIQESFMTWVKVQYPKFTRFVFHIPNGGKMSVLQGYRLKKRGVRRGVADILFMWKKQDFGGLWLEFKTSKGKQNEAQKDFEQDCHTAQYDYQLVRSLKDAVNAFVRYMNLP